MGLFDRFRQSTTSPAPADLSALLQRAAADPAQRENFYRALLTSPLYVLVETSANSPTAGPPFQTADGTSAYLRLLTFAGKSVLPAFTSEKALARYVQIDTPFISAPGRDILALTPAGATVRLNPGSPVDKTLLPDELAALLNGTLFTAQLRTQSLGEADLVVRAPKDYPADLAAALFVGLSPLPAVKSARIAEIEQPGSEGQAPQVGLLIVIDLIGELAAIAPALDALSHAIPDRSHSLDFVKFDPRDPLLAKIAADMPPVFSRA